MPTINVHCTCFPSIVSERMCFSVPNKVRLIKAVSHCEFSYYRPLSPLSSFRRLLHLVARIIATPLYDRISFPVIETRDCRARVAGLRIRSSKRRSRRNGAVPRANNRFARSVFHRVASPTLRERLLLSTRPCVSRTPAFVVVVIVSSRVMGRFQARRGGGPALEAALKGSLGKRRHVGAHLRSRRAASRDATVAGEQ